VNLAKRILKLVIAFHLLAGAQAFAANPVVRFYTDFGDIDVVLLQDIAPATVANFLGYVNRKDYDNTFIHRSVMNFVIQGGGYKYLNDIVVPVPQQPPVVNEFNVSNTRGTLAMAKLGGDPNSATNQWFFNLGDNSANLDNQNGGFTVFGRVANSSSLATMDAIAAVPIYDASAPFDQLPLKNYTSGPIQDSNLVHIISVVLIPELEISRSAAGSIRLQITGAPSTEYQIEFSPSLHSDSFSPLVTLTTDSDGVATHDDVTSAPMRFYRVGIPP
jgi:cyclophilin family peptidyl-prolyl cis-trans isomerase